MGNFFQHLQKYTLLQALFYSVLGIILLIHPQDVFNFILYGLGAYCVVLGVLGIFQERKVQNTFQASYVPHLLLILLGILVVIFTPTLIKLVNIVFGIFILANGLGKVFEGLDLRKRVINAGTPLIIYGGILAVVGFVVFFNPFSTFLLLFQVIGFILLVMGIFDLLGYFGLKKYQN